MARKPLHKSPLHVVSDIDDFSDLILMDENEASDVVAEPYEDGEGTDIEDALSSLRQMVDDAVDFMNSEFVPNWEDAEEFFNGETDLPLVAGRSRAVQTVFRDSVRSLKPNMMRVFAQAPKIVEYSAPAALNFGLATLCEVQTAFVNQLFWRYDGYRVLLDAVDNTLKKKVGVMKAVFEEVVADEYLKLSNVTQEQLQAIEQMPDVFIISAEPMQIPQNDVAPPEQSAVTDLLRLEVAYRRTSGRLSAATVPLQEFFVDDRATCPDDATVIGQRRSVTVSQAIEMGLEYDGDWMELSDLDPEDDASSGETEARRGYMPDSEKDNLDPTNHHFLLTEAYAKFDLEGTGVGQLYRFWLGGTDYRLIKHERVAENPYAVAQADPIPGAFFGHSLFDVLREDQNTQTSLLRATCDNAHASNNRRLAVHDTLVNMQDVMNPRLGAPIRFKTPGMIQEVGTESTIGALLPLIQYLRQNSSDKVGATQASMGLDPDALQSTDKDAVRNTIQLGQGQVELMCRNIAETGLRQLFTKLLKLSMRHNPQQQIVAVNGNYLPIPQTIFDPELSMEVSIGVGNADVQMQLAALQQIAQQQEKIITQFGLENPICGINHLLTTIVDIGKLMGIQNMGRYFNSVTPEAVQQLSQQMQAAAEAQKQEPPSQAIAIAEQIRADARIQDRELSNKEADENRNQQSRLKMIELMMKDDLERDRMAQQLEVDKAKMTTGIVNDAMLQYEQNRDRQHDMAKAAISEATRRQQVAEQEMMMQKQRASEAQQQQAAAQQPPQGTPQG